ncbi:FtsQ-type POTRA domain-containing protein [Streptomyces sp. AJS327]|nr:FtsQ-type POTRA domain-containing protein [Streptomyces sp. AJS327]
MLLALLLAVVLGGLGGWLLYGSPWLRVDRVAVSGTDVLTERQVREVAAVQEGGPLVSVDKEAVERRLRAELPRIREARVVRSWPNGIGLKVTERQPELVMKRAGIYVEMDREGVRFATAERRPKGVPLLVFELERSAVSTRHFGAEKLRQAAAKTAAGLPRPVRRAAETVRVRSYDDITVELTDGRTVLWGSAERPGAKAKSLTALMKAAKDAEHFDVSVPSAPAASGS